MTKEECNHDFQPIVMYHPSGFGIGDKMCSKCNLAVKNSDTKEDLKKEYLKWEDVYYRKHDGYPIQSIIADWWLESFDLYKKELVESLKERRENYNDHICLFNDHLQVCHCYGEALDEVISIINEK